jgi:hypothetical protein
MHPPGLSAYSSNYTSPPMSVDRIAQPPGRVWVFTHVIYELHLSLRSGGPRSADGRGRSAVLHVTSSNGIQSRPGAAASRTTAATRLAADSDPGSRRERPRIRPRGTPSIRPRRRERSGSRRSSLCRCRVRRLGRRRLTCGVATSTPPGPGAPTAANLGPSSSSKMTGSTQPPRLPLSRSPQIRSKRRCCDFQCSPQMEPV